MKPPHLVVLGSANTDLVVRVPRLPSPGETVTGGQFEICPGGKGANQAVAAARAGAKVTFIGSVGADDFGKTMVAGLRRDGIDTRLVLRQPRQASGVALIFVGEGGENQIAVARGANDALTVSQVEAAAAVIRAAKCLVAQLEVPLAAVRRALQIAAAAGVPVILNPAPAPARPLPRSLLRQVTFLTPNQAELGALTVRKIRGRAAVEKATRDLQAAGVPHVLATCGAGGVCWRSATDAKWFPAARVRAIDTVGAGDCFTGAFAAAFAQGQEIEAAIHFAIAAAGISVTRRGAQAAMPAREEIERARVRLRMDN